MSGSAKGIKASWLRQDRNLEQRAVQITGSTQSCLPAALAFVLAAAVVATSPVASAADGLRVISLDVSNAPAVQSPIAQTPAKPSWRTSFGSERDTRPEPAGPVQEIDADIVLLQGVTSLKALQRAFPGRSWRLIISRQMVLTDDPVDPRSYEAVSSDPATAVAVRYQVGVRVAGQDYFLASHSEPAATQPSAVAQERLVAGTAARINIGGRFVWVASVSFATVCTDASAPCPQRDTFETWRQLKLSAGEAVISGGLHHVPLAPGVPPLCSDQTVTIFPARKDASQLLTRATEREGLGCAAVAETGSAAASQAAGDVPQ
jgi:hypothetical protein